MAAAMHRSGKAAVNVAQQILRPVTEKAQTWVFLGPPGVGKGTYSSRIADILGVSHVSVGDLVRKEIQKGSSYGRLAAAAVAQGELLSDDLIVEVLDKRMEAGSRCGEHGFLLDGFPRTRAQAQSLMQVTDVQLAVNLQLREEALIQKCLGRRKCSCCGKDYNVAAIDLPANAEWPAMKMPPLSPPASCRDHLEMRADDTAEVFARRLEIYKQEAAPVEEIFQKAGLLLDFKITGGIPETMPRLVEALRPYNWQLNAPKAQTA